MKKDEVIELLENRLAEIKDKEPGAFNAIAAYESVINDLMGED